LIELDTAAGLVVNTNQRQPPKPASAGFQQRALQLPDFIKKRIKSMENIGFLGLGIMGAPMAGHLLDAGFSVVTAVNRTQPSAELIAKGLKVAGSAREVTAGADIIFLMLPDTPQVASVLFGENGVAAGLSAGKLVVDLSSISPIETKVFAGRINALGCDYLDAPVSGGEVGAKAASLTIMVGGPEAAFERARPAFGKMGKNITLIGDNGAGQTTKVANQIVVALTIEAVAEALVFASRAGVDPAKVRQALMGGLAASRILEVHGERMIKRTFNPGFRIELHQKDLNLALDGARALGVSLPNTASTQQLFSACIANGGAAWDHSGLVKALELLAGHEVASPS
jgi:2-hydroxy-3-oxopropionate reductase